MNNVRNIAEAAGRAFAQARAVMRAAESLLPLPPLSRRPYPGVGPAGLRAVLLEASFI